MSVQRRAVFAAAIGPNFEALEARRMFDSNPTFNYVDVNLSSAEAFQNCGSTMVPAIASILYNVGRL